MAGSYYLPILWSVVSSKEDGSGFLWSFLLVLFSHFSSAWLPPSPNFRGTIGFLPQLVFHLAGWAWVGLISSWRGAELARRFFSGYLGSLQNFYFYSWDLFLFHLFRNRPLGFLGKLPVGRDPIPRKNFRVFVFFFNLALHLHLEPPPSSQSP